MPMAIPLIAAGASAWAGAGLMAAGTFGASLLGGAMIAGGALTAIGAITGNKNLTKYGGILSMVGGVGALATGAFSATAGQIASDAAIPDAMSAGAGGAADAGGASLGGAADAGSAASQVGSASDPFGMGGSMPTDPGASGFGSGPSAPGVSAPGNPTIGVGQLPPGASYPPGQGPFGGVSPGLQAPAAPPQGMLGSALQWAQDNPKLVQAGAGMLTSMGNNFAAADAQKEQIKMQEAAAQRARDRLNASVIGAKPMPTWQPTKVGG
jgi:hypothetical protein